MTVAETQYVGSLLRRAKVARSWLPTGPRRDVLHAIATALQEDAAHIESMNALDVAQETAKGTAAALVDRLRLDRRRIDAVADACRDVARLDDPLHKVVGGHRTAAGVDVRRVTVPFGTIGMIYESRPNVTVDAAALCLMAGSAVVLRGSTSAMRSNVALVATMRRAIEEMGFDPDVVQLIEDGDRRHVTDLLSARGAVDLVIPRGGPSLIAHVVETAKVPVIETGVGNCHVYVHAEANLEMALDIVENGKVQRPGVCNAVETVLVDAAVAPTFVPVMTELLTKHGVDMRGCDVARALAPMAVATDDDYAEEFLDLTLAVRVVDGLEEAIDHIGRFGSQHSEAIVTESRDAARAFQARIDAAAVYVNASTRFTDGFEFGFGAEIGISTQKLHARGPMGLAEMVTTKYLIDGSGQVRGQVSAERSKLPPIGS